MLFLDVFFKAHYLLSQSALFHALCTYSLTDLPVSIKSPIFVHWVQLENLEKYPHLKILSLGQLANQEHRNTAPIRNMGRRRRQGNPTHQNNSVEDLVGNEEN
jgi:hypothetical protein